MKKKFIDKDVELAKQKFNTLSSIDFYFWLRETYPDKAYRDTILLVVALS